MKNKKQPTTSKTTTKTTKSKSTTTSNTSASSGTNKNISKKLQNEKPKEKANDKIGQSKNKSSTPVKSENKIEKEKIIIDFKEILKPSEITKNENVNLGLYVELMNNLDKKDDIKTLGICRLILEEDPNNKKIKELHDIIYENIKENYYETGELEPSKEEKMDKHMKLNKDGEYEYQFSDESEDEK